MYNESTSLAKSVHTTTEGAGAIQRMGACERVSKVLCLKNPLATVFTCSGTTMGTIATGFQLSAPKTCCSMASYACGFYFCAAIWCFFGLCATPPGERLRSEHIRPCMQKCGTCCYESCTNDYDSGSDF